MSDVLVLIGVDLLVIVVIAVAVGATAPRWPDAWLRRDVFPLTRMPGETVAAYRRMRVPRLARRLPEAGGAFGGESKSALPGLSTGDLTRYLIEVRRGEWVHWVSMVSPAVLFLFNPWWLALAFWVATVLGNLPFVLVLRHNRWRIEYILEGRTA